MRHRNRIAEPPLTMFHGTSAAALNAIAKGHPIQPIFETSNVSLGGTYFTTSPFKAWFHAKLAASCHKTEPILLFVAPDELLPDEDWVVTAFEQLPAKKDIICDPRMRAFFDDLFQNYEPFSSLSDHYKARYEELNTRHNITAADSLHWMKSARQSEPLSLHQVVNIFPNPTIFGISK